VPFPYKSARNLTIAAFLLRGAFYCAVQPMWEGFDEWAHFGYIQHLAQFGRAPSRYEQISDELRRSVELAPISAAAAESSAGSLTHDAFWQLPLEERLSRERELRQLRPSYKGGPLTDSGLRQYEAQQAPLYYSLLALVYLTVKDDSLPARVFALRLVTLFIGAVGILLGCELAREVPSSRRAAIPVLVLLALSPGVLVDLTRIANDSLALTLGSAFLLCLCRTLRGASRLRDWMLAGTALGAALLTKSYMLALVPLLGLAALIELLRGKLKLSQAAGRLLLALAFAGSIAGWWYVGAWQATGTISGEQIDIAATRFGLSGKLAAVGSIQWLRVLDAAATTHIWISGWSFLVVRSWMYRVFECAAIAAGAGLIALSVRLLGKVYRRGLGIGDACFSLIACAYLLFCCGVAYFAIVVYLTRGISTALGWYLDGVAGVEAVLLAAGFTGLFGARRAAGCVAAVAALAGILDLYTVHFVSTPYYAGLTAHLPSGFLATFHPNSLRGIGLTGVFARLSMNKPAGLGPSALLVMWIGYLGATAGLIVYSGSLIKNALSAPSGEQASDTSFLVRY
jgi:Dolichyl-phosphate-mannose-protein mannosyltransferase